MKRENEFLYLKLANLLRDQITSDYIRPGDFLLSENQLATRYNMSRVSVRAALDILLNEGLVEKHERQGTVVLPRSNPAHYEQNILTIMCTYPFYYVEIVLPIVIEEFNKRFPDVKVNVVSIPIGSFDTSLNNPEYDRIRPDINILTDDQISDIYDSTQFVNLRDIFSSNSYIFNDMYDYLKKYFLNDANSFILPITFSTVFFSLNHKLFKDYDLKISEKFSNLKLRNIFKKMKLDSNNDGIVDRFALSILPFPTRWIAMANHFGVDFSNIRECREELIAAFEFFHDLLYRDHSAVLNMEPFDKLNPFYHDRAVFSISNAVEQAGWSYYNDSLETSAVPIFKNNRKKQLLMMDGVVLSKESKNIEMAIAFIKTLLSDTVQKRMSHEFGFPSVYKSINEVALGKDYLDSITLTDEIEEVFLVKDVFCNSNTFAECEQAMRLYWLGIDTAKNAAEQVIEIICRAQQ